jgi:DNA-directed RNA polymerase specialized sigma24 family protein
VTSQDFLAVEFEGNRPHLQAVAYRMLGSLAEAEDAVQEAWLRLARADAYNPSTDRWYGSAGKPSATNSW